MLTPVAGVEQDQNLIIRAAKALQHYSGCQKGVEIRVTKRLPMGGGLGGGSSNAATTLVALNQLWQCHLTTDELAEIGLGIGADVAVFIRGHAAWAEGVGEKLSPISPAEPWYVVVIPDCHVSTAEVFSSQELTRDCEPITISRFLSGEGRNICEDVVTHHYPAVSKALTWLNQYGKAKMSGTGACLFAAFENKQQAEQIADIVPADSQAFVAKGLNKSPLITMTKDHSTE